MMLLSRAVAKLAIVAQGGLNIPNMAAVRATFGSNRGKVRTVRLNDAGEDMKRPGKVNDWSKEKQRSKTLDDQC